MMELQTWNPAIIPPIVCECPECGGRLRVRGQVVTGIEADRLTVYVACQTDLLCVAIAFAVGRARPDWSDLRQRLEALLLERSYAVPRDQRGKLDV